MVLLVGLICLLGYSMVFLPNTNAKENIIFKIHSQPETESYDMILQHLKSDKILKSSLSFDVLAKVLHYPKKVKPGLYTIKPGMSNIDIVRMLRGGHQTPVVLRLHSIRTIQEACGKISHSLEIDSASLYAYLLDSSFLRKNTFTKENISAMFIPNSYEFYWNTSTENFVKRMKSEYDRFWNPKRLSQAEKLGLTPVEVSVLASIVQAEQQMHPDERPRIAGLYLNRLSDGMKLESDPTLIFALNDYSIRRVLKIHKEVESPYNTYKNFGLPPGPILIPDVSSIDAVLNAESHNYIFMCAKEDFSNYHNFAVDYSTHQDNAALFQAALNKKKIFH